VPSTALVHDYLLVMRGAERTFAAMASCWPAAPIYTLLFDPEGTANRFAGRTVHTSYLQRSGLGQAGFRLLLPLFPGATERLALDEHDLVISSTSAFSHGVRTRPGAVHISYCHSPFRYAWHECARTLAQTSTYLRPVLRRVLDRVRDWDLEASQRVTHYIANSQITKERIMEYYGRDSRIVHPPVEIERFHAGEPEDFFLVVSEVVWHKRIEIALEAARAAGRRIVVVGSGPDRETLQERYGGTAQFLGRVTDSDLVDLYSRARAVVVPNVEEFGIAAVEGQAAGRPVIAADAGGARETVLHGETGVLVEPGNVDAFAQAMRDADGGGFSPGRIREHASQFSADAFRRRLSGEVARLTGTEGP